jgi:hypothetical protein
MNIKRKLKEARIINRVMIFAQLLHNSNTTITNFFYYQLSNEK